MANKTITVTPSAATAGADRHDDHFIRLLQLQCTSLVTSFQHSNDDKPIFNHKATDFKLTQNTEKIAMVIVSKTYCQIKTMIMKVIHSSSNCNN